ncbi:MAG: MFS transporter [Spirochaetes bacterium]|nr:MFS transporter [Spirochaetota bacterium]
MTSDTSRDRLGIATKVFYLFGDIGISMCIAAVAFFILFFYADVAHVDPALVGTALLMGKLWDAVNDPFFGWLTDRTKSRFGRRKIYLYFGAVPLGISFVLLWSIPESLTGIAVILWIVGTFLLYYTFITVVGIPYYAMTPELTRDYDERTSLTTFRMIGGTLGYMAGAAFPPLIAGLFMTSRIGWQMMGAMFAAFAILCVYVTAFGVKQRKELEGPPSELPPFRSLLACFKNRPFNFLLIQGVMTGMSFMLVMSYMAFFLTYQMNMKSKIPLLMTLLLVTIGVFLFFWKWLTDRWAKGPVYALGLFIAFGSTACTFLLPQGETPWIYLIIFIAGFGFSAQWVLPWSILPDVIEYDELMTGERREGMYYGVKGFIGKLSDAFGLFLGGWILKLFGFVPEVAQSATALLGIRLFFGPVPAIITFLSLPFLIWFPINRKTHREILEKLIIKRKERGIS